ncbi:MULTISPECIES: LacI family DNA-binding transcriptional regulator [unclassified Luteococcus]|uniref:LacI family DNA-binding transcriptional regulator n=1 Tax=unclassified Luteococcus TaxID=2639923 RepID=UPI00313BB9C2
MTLSNIREVALQAGVSPATVSRVVNGMDGFSEDTRLRVEQAIADLNYQPDQFARGLRSPHAQLIGVLAPKVSDAFAFEILEGVEASARDHGYAVMLGRTGLGSTFSQQYLRTMRAYRAAGIVLISAVITDELRRTLGTTRPVISVAISDGSGTPSIAIDDRQAGFDGIQHLLRLGHRHIGVVAGDPRSVHVARPRLLGSEEALAKAGLEAATVHGDFFYASGADAVAQLLARDPHVTAIFAHSDEMAVAVIHELQRRGFRVPEDISVLGFDNTATALKVHPQLSTVGQPLREMGTVAVAKLLRSRNLASRVMTHRIIQRASTAPPRNT